MKYPGSRKTGIILFLAALLLFPTGSRAFLEAIVYVIALPLAATSEGLNDSSGDPTGKAANQSAQATGRASQQSSDGTRQDEDSESRPASPYEAERLSFVEQNLDELLVDMAAGGGEYLGSLALLEGCQPSLHVQLARAVQQNYQLIYDSTKPSPESVLQFVGQQIEADPLLHYGCNGIPISGLADEQAAEAIAAAGKSAGTITSLTGTYTSTRTNRQINSRFKASPTVILQQNGEQITGTFDNPDGRLWGEIEGNEISFDWALVNGSLGRGRWAVSADGAILQGTWTSVSGRDGGNWNLSRVGAAGALQTPELETLPVPDISGPWKVRVTRRTPDYWCFNGKRRFHVDLIQQGDKIHGTFDPGIGGEIDGSIAEGRLHFTWYTTRCSVDNRGEWSIGADGSTLQGKSERDFEWTLNR